MEPQDEMAQMFDKDFLVSALDDLKDLSTHLVQLCTLFSIGMVAEDVLNHLKGVQDICKILKDPALLKHPSDNIRSLVALCLTGLLSRIQFAAVVDMNNSTEADEVFHILIEAISLVGKATQNGRIAKCVVHFIAARKLMLPWLSSSEHMTLLLDTISSLLKRRVDKLSAENLFQIMLDCFDSTLRESQESDLAFLVLQLGWVRAGVDDEAGSDDRFKQIAREKIVGGKEDDDGVAALCDKFKKFRG
jgi:hypothetical protein